MHAYWSSGLVGGNWMFTELVAHQSGTIDTGLAVPCSSHFLVELGSMGHESLGGNGVKGRVGGYSFTGTS